MSTRTTREYRYVVALEWRGTVEIEVDEADTDDDLYDYVTDAAIDDAISSPAAYTVLDTEVTAVEA